MLSVTERPTKSYERRQMLAKTAAHLFGRKTYLETTIDEIASRAGVSKGAIYHHFSSKSDILLFLVKQTLEDLLYGLTEDLATLPDATARLRHIISRQVGYYADHLDEVKTLLNDRRCLIPEHTAEVAGLEAQYFEIVRAVVEEHLGEAGPNVAPIAFSLFGLCNWIPGWYRPGGQVPIEDLVELISNLFLDGLSGFRGEAK